MTWFKGLEDDSIKSWKELCDEFTSYFNASKTRKKPLRSTSSNSVECACKGRVPKTS